MTDPARTGVTLNVPVQVLKGEEAKQRFQEWLSDPPAYTMLPLHFPKGARLDHFDGRCGNCTQIIPPDYLRGTHSWLLPHVVAVDALGHCPACGVNTPFENRIREEADGLFMEWKHAEHGWVRRPMHMKLSDIVSTLFKRWFLRRKT